VKDEIKRAWAKYEKIRQPAWDEYVKIKQPAESGGEDSAE